MNLRISVVENVIAARQALKYLINFLLCKLFGKHLKLLFFLSLRKNSHFLSLIVKEQLHNNYKN